MPRGDRGLTKEAGREDTGTLGAPPLREGPAVGSGVMEGSMHSLTDTGAR